MPCTPGAVRIFHENRVLFAPGKASNAGGVAVSGLEMTQNSIRDSWSSRGGRPAPPPDHDPHPQDVRRDTAAAWGRPGDYVFGANVGGFMKVATAMLEQGVV